MTKVATVIDSITNRKNRKKIRFTPRRPSQFSLATFRFLHVQHCIRPAMPLGHYKLATNARHVKGDSEPVTV
jgi:hypothetical protein